MPQIIFKNRENIKSNLSQFLDSKNHKFYVGVIFDLKSAKTMEKGRRKKLTVLKRIKLY